MNDSILIIQNKVKDNLRKAMSDEALMRYNREHKKDYELGNKKGGGQAHWRLVASYPIEVRTLIINKYGIEALKDENFYKEFLKSEEMDLFRALPKSEF